MPPSAHWVALFQQPDALSPDDVRVHMVLLSLQVSHLAATFDALTALGTASLIAPTDLDHGLIDSPRDPDGSIVQLVERSI
ncbi:MAG TPA: hypothetical protein VLH79_06140 [Chthonomonadales bacterium]|nr:hypothetical protein [Chthonomonadales bacterium]